MVDENEDNNSGPKPKHGETAEDTSPKHNPCLGLGGRHNVFSRAAFGRTASQEYCSTLRRTKSTSQITEKTENEEECQVKPDKWCICRVPSKLRKVNEAAYTPQLLSIGPFHHGKPELNDMEIHKKIYYKKFLKRCNESEDELRQFINTRKKRIRSCYAGTNIIFAEIIAVDACFIIELFLRNVYETENHENDYILGSSLLRKAVKQDLILFENQLPYFLLQELYQELYQKKQNLPCSWPTPSNDHSIEIDKAKGPHDALLELTCEFFKDYKKGKPVKNIGTPKHFTDLVRHFQCPDKAKDGKHNSTPVQNIYAAKKLRASGVKFRALKDGPFNIEADEATKCKFYLACVRNMDLKLTPFEVKDETECIIRNIMALEQFLYPDEPYICNYFMLMDQLVDTVDDVDLLVENKVIINMLGSNKVVAKLVNKLCEQIMDDPSCYFGISDQLNNHYESCWNRHVATLKQVYFKDIWTSSSTVVGVFVLLFSVSGTAKHFMS